MTVLRERDISIVRLRAKTETDQEIADTYGINRSTVAMFRKKHNIPPCGRRKRVKAPKEPKPAKPFDGTITQCPPCWAGGVGPGKYTAKPRGKG